MQKFEFPVLETIASITLAIISFTVFLLLFPEMKNADMAAWVQAIGSIFAIFAAIWISYDQQRRQRRRDEEREIIEIRHMLLSIRDEIWFTYDAFQQRNGKLLENSKEGTPFIHKMPLAEKPFPVYEASVDKIGRIPDDKLRQLIIIGHGQARGMILSIRFNNSLVERFEDADYMARAMKDDVHHVQRELSLEMLVEYGNSLRRLYKEAVQSVEELVAAIDKFLNQNQNK